MEKLRSTYGESLLAEVAADGRIHATFNQTVARTGRLSSDRPNLHNIPVRTEEGRQLRRAFVPRPGSRFLVADYDQIELRVIAHLAARPRARGRLRRATATSTGPRRRSVFGVAPEDVTGPQRNRAKMVSYGLAYGMEAYGLAQRLVDRDRRGPADPRRLLRGLPGGARLHGRRRWPRPGPRATPRRCSGVAGPLPDLHSPNRNLRMAAERQAMNAGIQGLAADLFKVALVRLDGALEEQELSSRLVLQVHDEVLLEVPDGRGGRSPVTWSRACSAEVADAVTWPVPLEVSSAWGDTWADAKGCDAGRDSWRRPRAARAVRAAPLLGLLARPPPAATPRALSMRAVSSYP